MYSNEEKFLNKTVNKVKITLENPYQLKKNKL